MGSASGRPFRWPWLGPPEKAALFFARFWAILAVMQAGLVGVKFARSDATLSPWWNVAMAAVYAAAALYNFWRYRQTLRLREREPAPEANR